MQIQTTVAASALLVALLGGCVSSHTEMGRDFDETRVSQIKNGSTNKATIQAMFGQPMGRLKMDGRETWTYQRITSSAGMNEQGRAQLGKTMAVGMIPIVGPLIAPGINPTTGISAASTGKTLTFSLIKTSCRRAVSPRQEAAAT